MLVICPKVGEFLSIRFVGNVAGLLNCAWLKMLKNSARNCTFCRSLMGVFLISVKSQYDFKIGGSLSALRLIHLVAGFNEFERNV